MDGINCFCFKASEPLLIVIFFNVALLLASFFDVHCRHPPGQRLGNWKPSILTFFLIQYALVDCQSMTGEITRIYLYLLDIFLFEFLPFNILLNFISNIF